MVVIQTLEVVKMTFQKINPEKIVNSEPLSNDYFSWIVRLIEMKDEKTKAHSIPIWITYGFMTIQGMEGVKNGHKKRMIPQTVVWASHED